MPGYSGGGWGGDGKADYGEGMGTKGAAAADHSIGTGAGAASTDTSIGAFRSAIAKALGHEYGTLQDPGAGARDAMSAEIDAMMEAKARERSRQARTAQAAEMDAAYYGGQITDPEIGIDEATASSVRSTMEAMGMFDDETDTSPADDFDAELAYGTGATVAQDTHDADLALHTGATSLGTLGPHYGYDAVEEQVYGGKKSAFEQDVNKSVNIGIESEYDSHMNSLVSAVELEYENIMKNTAPFSKERNKALRELNAIKDTALYSKAYNVSNPSAVRNMLAKAMGYLGMGHAFSIAQALENKAIERGLFDRTTFDQMMKEFDDPGAFGPAGNPLGTGGSEQRQRNIIKELFYKVNPWARGLNQRQIDYYLDRPSELEWVQNLYNQMNPSGGMGQ